MNAEPISPYSPCSKTTSKKPKMSLQIRPGRPSDVSDFCTIFFDAFSTNIVNTSVFRVGTQEAWDFFHSSLTEEVTDPNAHFIVVEDDSTSPPTMAAFAKWNYVPASTEPQDPLPDDWPRNGDQELAREFFGELHAKHGEVMGGREHWYLELVATRTGYQRKGLGEKLVGWGIQKAAEDRLECYLDSTPGARGLYERLGFNTVATTSFLDGTYIQYFMVREKDR